MLPRLNLRQMRLRGSLTRPWHSRAHTAAAILLSCLAAASTATWAVPSEPDTTAPVTVAVTLAPKVLPATEDMLKPYRGSGTWVDVYDWSLRYGGGAFGVKDVDKAAAAGYQTLYIQTTKAKLTEPVLEPARLKSIIRRAHERGLSVVGWYLPTHSNESRDFQKTAAMLRLGVDGIGLDLESTVVKDVPQRSAAAVRLMRRIYAKVQTSGQHLALASITYTPFTLDSSKRLWPDFPWRALADYTHVWMPMSYWSQQLGRSNGMDNATTYTNDSITRLRQRLGDAVRIHMIGGSGTSPFQVERMVGAIRAAGANIIGGSLYDWRTTISASHPRMRPLRILRTPVDAPTSDIAVSGDTVAYRTSGGNIEVRRVSEDGRWWAEQNILGSVTGTPSIAVDHRPNRDRWFVVAPTPTGVGWAYGSHGSTALTLKQMWKSPSGCVPTVSRWARAGYVVFCRTETSLKFSVYNPGITRWSRWATVPIAEVPRAMTAAPLGSQVVIAWTTADGAAKLTLWDPALPESVTTRAVTVQGNPLLTQAAPRLNGYVAESSDTTSNLWLTTRTASATNVTWVSRDSFAAADIATTQNTAASGVVRPLAEVWFSATTKRVINRANLAVTIGPLGTRDPIISPS